MTTTTHTPTTGSKLTAALEGYRARRAARVQRTRIEQELSTYRTANEIQELDAMVERAGDDLDPMYVQVIERVRQRAA
jgi:hypothetical protein